MKEVYIIEEWRYYMVSQKVAIKNKLGFHARPAAVLTQVAIKFDSKIDIVFEEKRITAKSILGIMSTGIQCGDIIEIQCEGQDEEEALHAIIHSIEDGLGEEI